MNLAQLSIPRVFNSNQQQQLGTALIYLVVCF